MNDVAVMYAGLLALACIFVASMLILAVFMALKLDSLTESFETLQIEVKSIKQLESKPMLDISQFTPVEE